MICCQSLLAALEISWQVSVISDWPHIYKDNKNMLNSRIYFLGGIFPLKIEWNRVDSVFLFTLISLSVDDFGCPV